MYLLVIVLSTIFGALSGSAVAVAAMLGRSLLPQMSAMGYNKQLASSTILAGASLAPIIPPSVLVIVIGSLVTNVSIAGLLIAGIIPGAIIAVVFASYIGIRVLLDPSLAPKQEVRPAISTKDVIKALLSTLPFGLVIFSVMGLILLGIATPSEAAAAAGRRHDLVLPSEPIATSVRVGLFRTPQWDHASTETKATVLECAERLSQAGIRVTSIDSPPAFESLLQAQIVIMEAEAAMSLSDEYSAHQDLCSERLIKSIERGFTIEIDRLLAARDVVRKAIASLEEIFKEVDVLLSPPAAGEAPEGLEATGDPMFGRIWSALGNPGITLPYGHGATGLPIGVLFTGARDQDRAFLHMAQTLEAKLRR
jgi:hypothetical protein